MNYKRKLLSLIICCFLQVASLSAQNINSDFESVGFRAIPIDNSVSIVGLGEFTHGGKEVILLKIDLVKYLIEEKGYSLVLLEYPDVLVKPINNYLQDSDRRNEARNLVYKHFNGAFIVEEMVQFIDMLKKHNLSRSDNIVLRGIDVNTEIFPSNASLIHEYILPYDYSGSAFFLKNERILDDTTMFASISEWATNNREQLKRKMDAEVYNSFILDLKSAEAAYFLRSRENSTFARDSFMAENVRFLIQEKKVIVWAHNFHLMKSTDRFEKQNLGYYLDEFYGDRFFNILTDFYQTATLNIITSNSEGQSVIAPRQYTPKRRSFPAKLEREQEFNNKTVLVLKDEAASGKSIRLNQIDMPGNHFTVGQRSSGPLNFDALILLGNVNPTTLLQ